MRHRLNPSLSDLPWLVLPKLMNASIALHKDIKARKDALKLAKIEGGHVRKKRKSGKKKGLRFHDLWLFVTIFAQRVLWCVKLFLPSDGGLLW